MRWRAASAAAAATLSPCVPHHWRASAASADRPGLEPHQEQACHRQPASTARSTPPAGIRAGELVMQEPSAPPPDIEAPQRLRRVAGGEPKYHPGKSRRPHRAPSEVHQVKARRTEARPRTGPPPEFVGGHAPPQAVSRRPPHGARNWTSHAAIPTRRHHQQHAGQGDHQRGRQPLSTVTAALQNSALIPLARDQEPAEFAQVAELRRSRISSALPGRAVLIPAGRAVPGRPSLAAGKSRSTRENAGGSAGARRPRVPLRFRQRVQKTAGRSRRPRPSKGSQRARGPSCPPAPAGSKIEGGAADAPPTGPAPPGPAANATTVPRPARHGNHGGETAVSFPSAWSSSAPSFFTSVAKVCGGPGGGVAPQQPALPFRFRPAPARRHRRRPGLLPGGPGFVLLLRFFRCAHGTSAPAGRERRFSRRALPGFNQTLCFGNCSPGVAHRAQQLVRDAGTADQRRNHLTHARSHGKSPPGPEGRRPFDAGIPPRTWGTSARPETNGVTGRAAPFPSSRGNLASAQPPRLGSTAATFPPSPYSTFPQPFRLAGDGRSPCSRCAARTGRRGVFSNGMSFGEPSNGRSGTSASGPAVFATTHWSLIVRAAEAGTPDGRPRWRSSAALIVSSLQFRPAAGAGAGRRGGSHARFPGGPAGAGRVDQGRCGAGRFRTFLLNHSTTTAPRTARAGAAKRGGGQTIVSLEDVRHAEGWFREEPRRRSLREGVRPEVGDEPHRGDAGRCAPGIRGGGQGALFDELKAALWAAGARSATRRPAAGWG